MFPYRRLVVVVSRSQSQEAMLGKEQEVEADLLYVAGTSLMTNSKRSEGIKLNENKTEWRHQSGTKGSFNAVLTVLIIINELNDKV